MWYSYVLCIHQRVRAHTRIPTYIEIYAAAYYHLIVWSLPHFRANNYKYMITNNAEINMEKMCTSNNNTNIKWICNSMEWNEADIECLNLVEINCEYLCLIIRTLSRSALT